MIRWMCRYCGLLATLALVLLVMPARRRAGSALQVVYVQAGDAQPNAALRAWLERRGIAYQVAGIGLAMEINEAEMEALAERGDVLLIRAPYPSEPLPDRAAPLDTRRMWLPLVGR